MAVLWGSALVDLGVAAFVWLSMHGAVLWIVPLLLLGGILPLHVLYATEYVFEGDALRIRASLFRWTVPLAAIESVEPTSNPLSSPAVSLDRLLIRYGDKRIMISPEDKVGFLHTLALRAPHLEIAGDGARRREG